MKHMFTTLFSIQDLNNHLASVEFQPNAGYGNANFGESLNLET
jgi:hypothetical protein